MLGYKTHADFVLEESMAKTPENFTNCSMNVWAYALRRQKKKQQTPKTDRCRRGNFKLHPGTGGIIPKNSASRNIHSTRRD
jgi:peptidyl-dipeptidase Dcp